MPRAIIVWLSSEEGGRRGGPPSGPRYVAPAKFLAHLESWLVEGWSLVVNKIENLSSTRQWFASIQFLVPEAPQEWLEPEAEFELCEGDRTVARGRIVDNEQVNHLPEIM